ncbi:hypothetical protein CBOM_04043 [Ceraceosorus bombacis]|uniref:WD40/YVTN repeat-like-containing domain n=1 Tax=Ceraceosorus bombacis TaxID=401625 RepID=A0A0P1BN78_9BASI|nr:hypothetical protein CBOM_04043 [Ceraceosorus bombacis]
MSTGVMWKDTLLMLLLLQSAEGSEPEYHELPEEDGTLLEEASHQFSKGLRSVRYHPSLARLLLVSDIAGTLHVLDWTESASTSYSGGLGNMDLRSSSLTPGRKVLLTVSSPKLLASNVLYRTRLHSAGKAEWRDEDSFGAALGTQWAIWDLKNAFGGTPALTGGLPNTASAGATVIARSGTESGGGLLFSHQNRSSFLTFSRATVSSAKEVRLQLHEASIRRGRASEVFESSTGLDVPHSILTRTGAKGWQAGIAGPAIRDAAWVPLPVQDDVAGTDRERIVVLLGDDVVVVPKHLGLDFLTA